MADNESKTTTDHDTIRQWAQTRDGRPAQIKSTASDNDAGLLRIEFPDYDGEALEHIPWEDFFAKFEEAGLALVYQEETADGQRSNFNKLVSR